jgi:hypothetical protein
MAICINTARELIEDSIDFDYIESEGDDCIRFDLGSDSFWIYQSGYVGDLEHMPEHIKLKVRMILIMCQV